MDITTFEKIILKLQLAHARSEKIHDLGIDLLEFEQPYQFIIDELFKEIFNQKQMGWIDWYLYERPSLTKKGSTNKAWKTDSKTGEKIEICYDIPSLWEEVCESSKED
jgi:hypothetical protein